MPPLHDIAHLAHVELRSAQPTETVEFFTRYLGLLQNGASGDAAGSVRVVNC
ncbi:MAG TPA: hypothetical protein VLL08_13025 [Kineosporiaceae bacterium]|nr:hypothetical protein [Kineosporiaceae bacterium]